MADGETGQNQQKERRKKQLLDRKSKLGLDAGPMLKAPSAFAHTMESRSPLGTGPMPQMAQLAIERNRAAKESNVPDEGPMNRTARRAAKKKQEVFG
jgi:hypothetical protein